MPRGASIRSGFSGDAPPPHARERVEWLPEYRNQIGGGFQVARSLSDRDGALSAYAEEVHLCFASRADVEAQLSDTHEETRGCMFDLCGAKTDIEIKLQTMDICQDCRSRLAERGIDVRAMSQLCDVVRTLAVSKAGA